MKRSAPSGLAAARTGALLATARQAGSPKRLPKRSPIHMPSASVAIDGEQASVRPPSDRSQEPAAQTAETVLPDALRC